MRLLYTYLLVAILSSSAAQAGSLLCNQLFRGIKKGTANFDDFEQGLLESRKSFNQQKERERAANKTPTTESKPRIPRWQQKQEANIAFSHLFSEEKGSQSDNLESVSSPRQLDKYLKIKYGIGEEDPIGPFIKRIQTSIGGTKLEKERQLRNLGITPIDWNIIKDVIKFDSLLYQTDRMTELTKDFLIRVEPVSEWLNQVLQLKTLIHSITGDLSSLNRAKLKVLSEFKEISPALSTEALIQMLFESKAIPRLTSLNAETLSTLIYKDIHEMNLKDLKIFIRIIEIYREESEITREVISILHEAGVPTGESSLLGDYAKNLRLNFRDSSQAKSFKQLSLETGFLETDFVFLESLPSLSELSAITYRPVGGKLIEENRRIINIRVAKAIAHLFKYYRGELPKWEPPPSNLNPMG